MTYLLALVGILCLAPLIAAIYVVLAIVVILDNISLGVRPFYSFRA